MKFCVDDLIDKKLVTAKESPCGKYRLLKYHRKVFYDNLWHVDHRITKCRGIVVDQENNVVLYPFDKIFNYGENDTGIFLNHREVYRVVEKLNGFLAQAAVVDGEVIVTSSGSFDSEHAAMARDMIDQALTWQRAKLQSGFTYMFEICHPDDPHIVEEVPGAYLIGVREMELMTLKGEHFVDFAAREMGFKRPAHFLLTLEDAVRESKIVKHEGFILRELSRDLPVLKLKSKHYLNKKALMRMGKNSAAHMFSNPQHFKKERLEEEFYNLFDWIIRFYDQESWTSLTEQDRRAIIEEYFRETAL